MSTPIKPCLYISGPMSGYEDYNFAAFNDASARLRAAGYPVINPADFGADPKHTWEACMKRDIATLVHCDIVVALEGWGKSKGARLEIHIAEQLGMPIRSLGEMLTCGS